MFKNNNPINDFYLKKVAFKTSYQFYTWKKVFTLAYIKGSLPGNNFHHNLLPVYFKKTLDFSLVPILCY